MANVKMTKPILKLKISLIFPIVFVSVLGFLFSFSIQEVLAATEILRPNAAGDAGSIGSIEGQYPSSGAHWDKVDEATADDATTYVYSAVGAFREEFYNLPAHGVGSGTINFVKIYYRGRCKNVNSYGCTVCAALKTNNEERETSGCISFTTSWTTNSQQYNTNPVTKSAWTWAEIDALQIGGYIGGYNATYAAQLTQVYVEIDYTSISPPTVTTDIATVGATEIQNNQAIFRGTVTNNGGATTTYIRFMWGTTSGSYPNSSGDIACSGCSTFQWTKTGMTASTTYYYKAQASNSAGWSNLATTNERRAVIYQAAGGQQQFTTEVAKCIIGGTTYNNGDYNPTNKCQICDVSKSIITWSNVTDGTDPANWCSPTWNSCDSACIKRGGDGNCYSGACDTNRRTGYISTSGLVCSGGNEVAPTSGNYCDYAHGCVAGVCYADKYWRGCAAGSASCSSTGWVDSGTDYNAGDGTVISVTETKVNAVCQTAVPSASLKCNTVLANNNNCQYTTYYRACGGGGACRTDNTYAASQQTTCGTNQATKGATSCSAVTTANYCDYACDGLCRIGYRGCSSSGTTCEVTFRAFANCGASACSGGTCASGNYCATNQCRDGSGWHHKCSKWCDGANGCNDWADATCVDHCANGTKDCDETGTDTGGSCPVVVCVIGGTTYNNGDYNPANKCQICDVSKSIITWSNVTDNTDPANWCSPTWTSCDSACVRRGGDGYCDGAGACDTNDATENIPSGYVCTGAGSSVALSCTNYCGTAGNICTGDRYQYQNRQACGGTGSCNGSVISCLLQDCGATSYTCFSKCRRDYTFTCSNGVCGTYHTYTTASQGERCETGSLINTGSCATSVYNSRSADKCDKKRDLYRCNGTGYNDSDCNYDVGDEWVYISVNKIANASGQEVDASSGDNTGTCHSCTEGSCSGTLKWSECDGSGNPGPCATYNQPETVYPSAGYTLTSTCGTTGTTLCDYSTWNGCNGSCQKKRDQLRCDASHNCAYDVGDDLSYLSTSGMVCSAGSETNPSATVNCDKTITCTQNTCSAARYYRGCTAGATTCTETGRVYFGAWNAPTNYNISETIYKVGDTCNTNQDICGYSTYNKCGGTGSPYSCQKGRDMYRCNDTAGTCVYDVGDEWLNVTAGYVCSGGSEVALSCTYYCGPAGNYCTEDRHKGEFRMACGGGGVCNGSTIGCNNIQDCGATSNTCSSKCQKDYIYTCSAGTCGTYHSYTNASQGYYCSGGSLINTGSCAVSAYNARSADKCDKKRDLYRCDGLGGTDANCNFDVGDEWAYVSAYKIANASGQEVDASSGDNTGTCHSCTEGSCSGTLKWAECDGSGNPGPCTTYNQPETVYPSAGFTLTSTCGTTGTTLCDYSTWNGCNGSCQKKRDQLRCDASHNCAYDVGDDLAYLSTAGKVCSAGSEVAPSSSINCDKRIDCVDNSCLANRYYRGCTAGAVSCTETGKVSYTAWNAASNYTISETTYKVGDTCNTNQDICSYSTYNKCGGTGSPYSCQKGRDQLRCNGSGSCTQDVGDEWLNVTAGYVCSAGSEVAVSTTYYCGFSTYNARSADKCDKKKDYLACNGSNVCSYGDYGDAYDPVSANKIANSSGSEVDASSSDYAGATCHSCTDSSCSGTLKWGECDGSGNPGPCATYNQPETVYPSAGYTLTSTCGATGTTNCDTNFCWDGGGHHEKCDRRCNAAHSCDYYNCVNHCANTLKDCDETGVDCGGSCPSCDITPPTTTIKIKRKSTGEDLTAAGSWLRADTYIIQFEDKDQSAGSGSNCENCSCEYSIYSCDVGGTNCNTPVVSLTSRTPNSSFDIVAGKTAPSYNLEGVGRYRIYSGARDMANYSAFEYRYINLDFTPPWTEIR